MKRENLGFTQIILAGMFGGIIPILVRFGENLGAYNLAFFRVFLSAVILGAFFLFYRKKLSPLKYEKGKMFLFGVVHGFIILGYFLAIQFLTITAAVLLMYLFPLWMIIFSHFILKEKINRKTWFALMIGLAGVIILLSPKDFFVKSYFWGLVAGLFAGMGAGFVYVLSKTFKKYDKVSLTFWQNLIAVPFVIPLLFIDLPKFTTIDYFIVLILGFGNVFAFILVYKGFQKVRASQGGIVMFLEIITPIILAFFIFNEIPNITTILGGILIIMAVLMVTINRSK